MNRPKRTKLSPTAKADAAKLMRRAKRQAAKLTAVDAKLRQASDSRRADVLATLPAALAACSAAVMPLLSLAAALIITTQLACVAPVVYKIIRRL